MNAAVIQTPIGPVYMEAEAGRLTRLFTNTDRTDPAPEGGVLREAQRQLGEYFAGTRTRFALPLHEQGTAFEQAVWARLKAIPYGETTTYAQIARELGSSPRAVGRANGRNQLSIIVPCHRVIGTDGSLTGYAGGIPVKRALLAHEQMAGAGRLSEPPGVAS